ncbi:Protein involved in catabolism of external DNA [Rubellimicrobium thermophilum DSM 16684]|uniref:Ribosomal RNA large subunit methyltransferase J n=1 Tax=Rubellimicrobium thermophilum DSM 16684 TaxID=1123069 RepID=S9R3V3_9RHOB|nr:23S rRNA (adenine(2030)-N(6))-methyltransferase RlmJ [Rubellimicrobium thermophilum]EPX86663.1 Protein involved in catabolism of external DNA [Rubellimicrobium thermophilum DSM 16684]
MLSYQHGYHAGNLADVHKHAMLAWLIDRLAAKDKPFHMMETHAGRGLYDLDSPEARRTGEAEAGIARVADWFPPDDPYARALRATRARFGPQAYPGSPLIAALLARREDRLSLAELHPQEHAALTAALSPFGARIERRDGPAAALAWTPPEPRRGLLLVDPSWEVKADYEAIPALLEKVHRKWNVGLLMLWYPLLPDARHAPMLARLVAAFPGALRHEVAFPPARAGHGMCGSGLFLVNPPWQTEARAAWLSARFATLRDQPARSASRRPVSRPR